MAEALIQALWESPGWAETLLWLALSAGLQYWVLGRTREQKKFLHWLTLLPVFLAALAMLLALVCSYASFFALIAALEDRNAPWAIFTLLSLQAGPFLFAALLPRAALYLAGWGLGWAVSAWVRRAKQPAEDQR